MTYPKQDVRQQFEAWARTVGLNTRRTDNGLYYVSEYADDAWDGYQAALQSPAVRELVEAANRYFMGYCQDEASEDGPDFTGCSQEQHEDAVRLRAALRTLGAGHVE